MGGGGGLRLKSCFQISILFFFDVLNSTILTIFFDLFLYWRSKLNDCDSGLEL